MHQRTVEEPTGEPAHFVPMVRTTPTALEMHPDELTEELSDSPEKLAS